MLLIELGYRIFLVPISLIVRPLGLLMMVVTWVFFVPPIAFLTGPLLNIILEMTKGYLSITAKASNRKPKLAIFLLVSVLPVAMLANIFFSMIIASKWANTFTIYVTTSHMRKGEIMAMIDWWPYADDVDRD